MTKPSTRDLQLAQWPAQRQQRRALGEDFTVPRPVEHFAYFRRRSAAQSAAEALELLGFGVVLARSGLKTGLKATREETLDDAAVSRFLGEIIPVVERERGQYDGWGATVSIRATAE